MKRSPRLVYLATAFLFFPAVGAGVLVGRSTPGRRPWWAEEKPVEPLVDDSLQAELSTCQEMLAARSRALATRSYSDASPGEPERAAARVPATVEGLEAELGRCRKNELLVSAEICSAAGRQFEALMGLPQDGLQCGPKSRAADLIEENFEHCAVFGDVPADVRAEELTKEQSNLIAEATRVHETITEKELLRRLKDFVYTCTETPSKPPPGLRKPPKRKDGDQ